MTLFDELSKNIQGDVQNSDHVKKVFSEDESILTLTPEIIVSPQNKQDIITAVEVARKYQANIKPRGGGSGVTGGALSDSIVLDFKTYMNDILELCDAAAWVQPGVILDDLNKLAMSKGMQFGPDPGSKAYACMGGIVGNNASGAHGLKYGMTRDHVKEVECVLSDGQSMSTSQMPQNFSGLIQVMAKEKALIRQTAVNVSKNASGFFVDEFLNDSPDFAKVLCGSEGHLAVFEKIKVNLVPIPKQKTFSVLSFENRHEAARVVKDLLGTSPSCVELVGPVVQSAMFVEDPTFCQELGLRKEGASLWVEWFDHVAKDLSMGFHSQDAEKIQDIWKFRSRASKLLHAQAMKRKPLRCIEDASVPIDQIAAYVLEVEALLQKHDCEGAIFGHIGNGHLHINPGIDITKPNLQKRIELLMDDFYSIVWRYKGSISGEHGDGVLRQKYLEKQWGPRMKLFEMLKETFDPKGVFQNTKMPSFKQWQV